MATRKRKVLVRRKRSEPIATGAATLKEALTAGLRLSWSALREAHPDETFYYFGIYTTSDAMYAQSMAAGEAALEHEDLRWSPPDSRYLDEGTHFFADAQRFLNDRPYDDGDAEVRYRLEAFAEALRRVDEENLFGDARSHLLLAVWWGDQSSRSRIEQARSLNPPAVLAQLETALRPDS